VTGARWEEVEAEVTAMWETVVVREMRMGEGKEETHLALAMRLLRNQRGQL